MCVYIILHPSRPFYAFPFTKWLSIWVYFGFLLIHIGNAVEELKRIRYATQFQIAVCMFGCVCVCVLDGNMTFLPSWVEREMGSLMDFIRRISGMRCVNEKSSFYSIRKWDFVVAFWCDVGEREWEWGERLTTVNVGGHHLCN